MNIIKELILYNKYAGVTLQFTQNGIYFTVEYNFLEGLLANSASTRRNMLTVKLSIFIYYK